VEKVTSAVWQLAARCLILGGRFSGSSYSDIAEIEGLSTYVAMATILGLKLL